MTLEQLRSQIGAIDTKIIELIRTRVDIASEIGLQKQKHQLPVRNFQVEQEVIARAEKKARTLKLPEAMIREVMNLLIQVATNEQYKNKSPETKVLEELSCLIIGGQGQMGSWLTMFFQTSGYHVETVDLVNADYNTLPEELDKYDLILIATPMDVIGQYLELLLDRRPSGVIADIGSLKSPILDKLLQCHQSGLNVTSIHPMFGPKVKTLAGRNLIITSLGNDFADGIIKQIFGETAINLHTIPLDEHDQIMLYSLGLAHSLSLIFAMMIKDSRYSFGEIMNVAGTTFLKQLETTQDVVFENAELYYQIQNFNHYRDELFDQYHQVIKGLHELITLDTPAQFKKMIGEAREFFGGK